MAQSKLAAFPRYLQPEVLRHVHHYVGNFPALINTIRTHLASQCFAGEQVTVLDPAAPLRPYVAAWHSNTFIILNLCCLQASWQSVEGVYGAR